MTGRAIVPCPLCKLGHNLPAGRHGKVTCHACGHQFLASTVAVRPIRVELGAAYIPLRGGARAFVAALVMGFFGGGAIGLFLPLGLWPIFLLWRFLNNAHGEVAPTAEYDSTFQYALALIGGASGAIVSLLRLSSNLGAPAPHYGGTVGQIRQALQNLLGRDGGLLAQRGLLWGWFNIVAGAILILLLVSSPFTAIYHAQMALLPDAYRALTAWVVLAVLAAPIVNGLRLLTKRARVPRYLLALAATLAPFFAAFVCYFVVVAIGLEIVGGFETPMAMVPLLGSVVVAFAAWWWTFLALRGWGPSLAQPYGKDLRGLDRRRPVLYLRSFHDDNRTVETTQPTVIVDKQVDGDFEQEIASIASIYGPFVCIGEPGVQPTSGAARDYYEGEAWREEVLKLMSEAVIIVMVAGYTEGLHWELTTAVERGWARKLVFLFPPGDPYHAARWDWVMSVFPETETRTQMAQARRDGVIAMHIDAQSTLVTFATERQSARSYQTALALAVYGKFLRQDGVLQLPSDWS
jgi:hypothetical protein